MGVASIPVVAILAIAFGVFGVAAGFTYRSIPLQVGLGVFLILGVSIIIARVSAKSFLATGSSNVLLLGVAVLEFGVIAALGGYVFSQSVDDGVAVYLLGALTAGSVHLVSGYLTYHGSPRRTSHLKNRVVVSYTLAVVFALILAFLSLLGVFGSVLGLQDSLVKSAVLSLIFITFLTSSYFFSRVYLRSHSTVLYWYSMALAMTAFGYLSFFTNKTTGDMGQWIGIAGLSLGSIYFLASVRATSKPTLLKGPSQIR
ncbi:MAG TPA: hypothetical protein VE177_01800 [Candidatus Binatus sp.]|nr:hypothetical protein [Candidatus Binatus sp.]